MFKKIYFPVHAITSLSVAAISHFSSLSTHPFFSITFTFYAPILAVTAVFLLALLRLGATQQAREAEDSAAEESRAETEEKSGELERDSSPSGSRPLEADPRSAVSFVPRTRYERYFVEWDVKPSRFGTGTGPEPIRNRRFRTGRFRFIRGHEPEPVGSEPWPCRVVDEDEEDGGQGAKPGGGIGVGIGWHGSRSRPRNDLSQRRCFCGGTVRWLWWRK